jgi:hypothetical protein
MDGFPWACLLSAGAGSYGGPQSGHGGSSRSVRVGRSCATSVISATQFGRTLPQKGSIGALGATHSIRIELICPTRQISLHSASRDDNGSKNPPRVNFNLPSDFKMIWVVQSLSQKYFAFAVGQISATSSPRPFPARGAYRDRHGRGMGCGGRGSVGAQFVHRAASVSEQRRAGRTALFAYGKTVWS